MKRILLCLLNVIVLCGLIRADGPEIKYSIERTLPYQTIMADGTFHSVPRTTIDRIEFSRTDTLGYEHQDYVSQIIILNNGDSIVLPIADIQSFEFQTPPTKYAPGVIVIDRDGLWEHVVESVANSFVLDSSTPSKLIPTVGQKIVTLRSDNPFPSGFSGEVKTITKRSDGTTLIDCKYVDLTETVLEHVESVVLHPYTDNAETPSAKSAEKSASKNPRYAMSLPLHLERDLAAELKSFVKPSKFPENSVTWNSKITTSHDFIIDASLTTTVLYGDQFLDFYIGLTHKAVLEVSGLIAYAGEIQLLKDPIKIGSFPCGASGIEFYGEVNIPLKFEIDVVGTSHFMAQETFGVRFFHSTNPNIKQTVKPTIKFDNEVLSNLSTDFNMSIGPELELGFRNVGFENPFGECGIKAYLNISGGLQFHGTDVLPNDDAATSTSFYNKYSNDCKMNAGFFFGGNFGLYAGVKIKIERPNQDIPEYGWSLETESEKLSIPFDPFWEVHKYPTFASPRLNLRNTESGIDEYSYGIDTKLANPVRVGYRIIDDETNETIYTDFAPTPYDGKEFKKFKYSVPIIPTLVGRKTTIYPLVKPGETDDSNPWEKEVLASKGVPIKVNVEPITGKATEIGLNEAAIHGEIDKYFFLRASLGHECGFFYSTQNIHSGSPKVKSNIGKSISTKLSNLKSGTKYYYAAYVKVGDEYIIGDVYNFTTLEDEYVDLGLSVKWCIKNIGANTETDYGNLYAWGETSPKYAYNWDTYFDSPYDANGHMAGCKLKTTNLEGEAQYDVVAANEEGARMPTKEEMVELINKCQWEWTTVNGVNGYRVSSTVNSNSIFIPAAGMQDGSEFANGGTYGGYWTSTIGSSVTKMAAINLYFTSSMKSTQQGNRYVGRSIRAVKP